MIGIGSSLERVRSLPPRIHLGYDEIRGDHYIGRVSSLPLASRRRSSTTGRSHLFIAIVGGFSSERASGHPPPVPLVLTRGVSYERTNAMYRVGGGGDLPVGVGVLCI